MNTYSFVNDGVNIVLGLSKGQRISQLSRTKFIKKMEELKSAFALVVFEENEQHINFSQEEQTLKEFADVVPEDIPPRLLSMRDNQQRIDFFPSASFLNKATYRMSTKEYEVLQRQVGELVNKDLL